MFKKTPIVSLLIMLTIFLVASGCSGSNSSTESSASAVSHIHHYETSVTQPTCTEEGATFFICSCGDSYCINIVQPLGHSYESSVIKPTYISEGYTQYVCRLCGNQYKDAYTPILSEIVTSLAEKDYLLPLEKFSRPRTQNPEFVMLHFTSAVVLSRDDPYNPELIRSIFSDYKVSVHYIVNRDGQVSCYIPEDLVALHAGYGTWENNPKYTDLLNEYTIGIEIMAIGSQNDMAQYMSASTYNLLSPEYIGFTDAQYESLKTLVQDICRRNNIPMDRQHIIGHEEYSPSKTDPGELFNWDRLFS